MNRLYLYLSVITAALCFEVVLCSWCYHEGKETEKEKYIKMLQQQREDFYQRYVALELKQNQQIEEYQVKLQELDKQHEENIKELMNENTKIKDSLTMSSTEFSDCMFKLRAEKNRKLSETNSSSSFECFRTGDIRTKIKESLDIARECDKLAERYNTLLKVCKE